MISRRIFLQQSAALVSPLAFAAIPEASKQAAGSHGKRITLIHDGGFEGDLWGWQLTEGASVDRNVARVKGASMQVHSESGDYARFFVFNPRAGAKYTLSGWVKTAGVRALSPDGGAFFAAPQFEFQARPAEYTDEGHIEQRHMGNVVGDTEWRRFEETLTCMTGTAWLEVTVGLYRASGTAWFDDITLVEGDRSAELSEVVEPAEAAAWAHAAIIEKCGRKRPRAAVLRDNIPVRGKATNPARIAELLRSSHDVEFISADDLLKPGALDRSRFDLLALPYGESFPVAAKAGLRHFLGQGGDLFSTGGYAFLSPLVRDSGAWIFDDEHVKKQKSQNLLHGTDFTGSTAELESAGWKRLEPGACDVDASLRAARVSLAPGKWGRTAGWHFTVPASGEGRRFFVEGEIRAENVDPTEGGYASLRLEQLDQNGYAVYATPDEIIRVTGTHDWQTVSRLITLSPVTKQLRVSFGMKSAAGTVWAKGLRLEERTPAPRINTASGFPQDELRIEPEQVGMFDPDYRLKRVARLETAPDQAISPERVEVKGEFSGYAATGVLGINNSRWIPVLNSYDRYGRLRGAAGAVMHNHGGVFARGSWAFFGVDNADLFQSDTLAGLVRSIGRTLADKFYLHELESDLYTYRDGEKARLRVKASNYGLATQSGTVVIDVVPEEGGAPVFERKIPVRLAPGETAILGVEWAPKNFDSAFYRMTARLVRGSRDADRIAGGFFVWKEESLRAGARIEVRDNYMRLGGRPMFLQGTDDYNYMFLDRSEGPLAIQDAAYGCKDSCVDIYENLMGLRGPQHNPPLTWWRWIDSMLLAVQRAGGVFMPGMLIFSDTAVSNADLEEQKTFCRRFAERYRSAPGLIYYLNGDLELHDPNVPDLQQLFRAYLTQKYGSEQALKDAWSFEPPKEQMNELKIRRGTNDWPNIQTLDSYQFRTELVKRWLGSLSRTIRSVDTSHPITAEFYQASDSGIDLPSACDDLDFANFGYFEATGRDARRFAAVLKLFDQSLKGKGANVGEFGVKTHPAWGEATSYIQQRSESYEQNYFLELTHTAFGEGAAHVQNWSWKYPADLPFEWGINYECDAVPRDVRAFYRNSGLLLRLFRPVYRTPKTVMLIPDENRKGGGGQVVFEGLLNALRLMVDARAQFGTLEDRVWQKLPADVRTILYPLSYCPKDEVVDHLEKFVRGGGQLYLSGDISYDSLRRRTKTDRLEKLCGVRFESEVYPNIAFESNMTAVRPCGGSGWPAFAGAPGIRVRPVTATPLAESSAGIPTVFENRLGGGKVIFTTDPFEAHAPVENPDGLRFYRALLDRLGVATDPVEPLDAEIHAYSIETHDHETVRVAVNYGSGDVASVRLGAGSQAVTFSLGGHKPGLAALRPDGAVVAFEGSGKAGHNGKALLDSDLHTAAAALDREPLVSSKRWMLLPMGQGVIRIPNAGRWSQPKAVVGAVERGRWKTYETFDPAATGGALSIPIDADRNLGILLVCEAGDEPACTSLVEKLIIRPWTLEQSARYGSRPAERLLTVR